MWRSVCVEYKGVCCILVSHFMGFLNDYWLLFNSNMLCGWFTVLFSSLGKLTGHVHNYTNVPQVCIWECSMSLKLSLFRNAPFMVNSVQIDNGKYLFDIRLTTLN